MKKIQLLLITVLMMGFSSFAFAGDKDTKAKNDSKTSETPIPAETGSEFATYYYHITSLVGGDYQMTRIDSPDEVSCPNGDDACVVSTSNNLGASTSAPKTTVDAGAGGFAVQGTQNL